MKPLRLFLLFITVFASVVAKAQFAIAGLPGTQFFDIVPDTFLFPMSSSGFAAPNELYTVDINQDGTGDFLFTTHLDYGVSYSDAYIIVSALNSNSSLSIGSTDTFPGYAPYNMLKIHNNYDTIRLGDFRSSGYLAYSIGVPAIGTYHSNVSWHSGSDKYIGVKWDDGNTILYGWIRVNVVNSASCSVKEYSAGLAVTGIMVTEIGSAALLVYPNPCSGFFFIHLPAKGDVTVSVTDIKRREVKSVKIQETISTIDVSDLSCGVYFVKLYINGQVLNRKLVIQ